MVEFLDSIFPNLNVSELLLAILYICAWIATLLSAPNQASSKLYKIVYVIINKLGANVGKAINSDDDAIQKKKEKKACERNSAKENKKSRKSKKAEIDDK